MNMKKIFFALCIAFFSLHASEKQPNVDANFDANNSTKQQLLIDKLKNKRSPKLAACKNLKCINNLLLEKQNERTNRVFDVFKVPPIKRKEYFERTKNGIPKELLIESEKRVIHASAINNQDLKLIKDVLLEYNINPHSVNILYDKKYFKEYPNAAAYAKFKCFFGIWHSPTIGINLEHTVTKHNIAHELTHLLEAHPIKDAELRNAIGNLEHESICKRKVSSKCYAYNKYLRSNEKIADLFPAIKNATYGIELEKIATNIIKDSVDLSNYAVSDIGYLRLSDPVATHPLPANLLHYIDKINVLHIEKQKRHTQKSELRMFNYFAILSNFN